MASLSNHNGTTAVVNTLDSEISDFIWDGSSVLTIAEVMKALRQSRPPVDTPRPILTASDQLTQAFKALVEFIDTSGKCSVGWRPSYESLGISTRECILKKGNDVNMCGVRLDCVRKQGAISFHCIANIKPDSAGGNEGLARGDVIVEINDQSLLGQSLAYANALMVSAWLGGKMVLQVLPAAIAQVLLPHLKTPTPSVRRIRPQQELVQNVVFGLYYIPTYDGDENEMRSRSLLKSRRSIKGLFVSSENSKKKELEQVSNTQEVRAQILRRALQYLTNSKSRFLVQEWLEVFRPALVQQFGAQAVEENDHFLKELISSFHMGPPKKDGVGRDSAGSDVDVDTPPLKEDEIDALRLESLNKAMSAWESEKTQIDDENLPEVEYVYHEDNLQTENCYRQETYESALKAWNAEKQRLKGMTSADALASQGSDGEQSTLRNTLQGNDEDEDDDRDPLNNLSPSKNKKLKSPVQEKSGRWGNRSMYKAQVMGLLKAAEQSWQAEKSRLVTLMTSNTSTASSSLHMMRNSAGRVSSRAQGLVETQSEDEASMLPSTLPEPNRPWYGKPK